MEKENIIDNVDQYSAEELVRYIRDGIVTFDELVNETDGCFSAPQRKDVMRLLESGDADEWERAKKEHTIEAAQRYLDIYQDGKYRDDARKMKAEIEKDKQLQNKKAETEEAWKNVDKNDIDSLKAFCDNYPDSPYVQEASNRVLEIIKGVGVDALVDKIKQIQTDKKLDVGQKDANIIREIKCYIETEKITKNDFLLAITEDYNLISAGVVKQLVEGGLLSIFDLYGIGIDEVFVRKMLEGAKLQNLDSSPKLDRIHKQSTEIYFWGIPSSGKSCALGAILSVAASGRVAHTMDKDIDSQGYGYMNQLINLFDTAQDGNIVSLMTGTEVTSFYEMGFDLIDDKKNVHPITCIDMAGELMRCMYKDNAKTKLEPQETEMLDTLHKVLIDNKTTNRKIHFFVVEYGAEDRQYEGLPQRIYLDAAVSYIKNTGIFQKETDAVYIMISKVDKAKNATKATLDQYIEEKYKGFYNGLKQICEDNEINNGQVEKIAFSLGEVCFQNYCRFNPKSAENVVRIILNRSASQRRGRLGKIIKSFKG